MLIAFAAAVAVVLGAIWIALASPSDETVATSGVVPQRYVHALDAGEQVCQRARVARNQADIVRVSVAGRGSSVGPLRLTVDELSSVETNPTAQGIAEFALPESLGAGDYKLCFENRGRKVMLLAGEGADVLATESLRSEKGTYSLWISLENRSPGSWWSRLGEMVARVGGTVGAPLGGSSGWVALGLLTIAIALALLGGSAAAVSGRSAVGLDSVDGSRARLPAMVSGRSALVVVAVVALSSGSAWAVLTPTFQVPDEPAHYAYVQYIAETGKLPGGSAEANAFSDEQAVAIEAVGAYSLIGRAYARARESGPQAERALDRSTSLSADNGGGRTGASPQPPLYYAVAALPYRVAAWAPLPTQVLVLRLFSVLLLAATAVVVALLAAELFPSLVWAPFLAGGLVALQPVMGFISAGATPEAMMDLLAASFFLAVVKGLRRPTVGTAVAIGGLAGAGAVTKITLVALLPGAVLAIAVLANRLRKSGQKRKATLAAVYGIAALGVLPAFYCAWTLAVGRGLFPPGSAPDLVPAEQIPPASLRELLSYLWQLYLPRVPGQIDQFSYSPVEETWVYGWLGRYGWLDYGIDGWVREAGKYVIAVVGALAIAGLVRNMRALGRRRWELAILALVTISLAAVIAVGGYLYVRNTRLTFEQARYLFPLAGLYGLLAVAAVLGSGARLRPIAIWALVVLAAVHALSGPFLTLARYYA